MQNRKYRNFDFKTHASSSHVPTDLLTHPMHLPFATKRKVNSKIDSLQNKNLLNHLYTRNKEISWIPHNVSQKQRGTIKPFNVKRWTHKSRAFGKEKKEETIPIKEETKINSKRNISFQIKESKWRYPNSHLNKRCEKKSSFSVPERVLRIFPQPLWCSLTAYLRRCISRFQPFVLECLTEHAPYLRPASSGCHRDHINIWDGF